MDATQQIEDSFFGEEEEEDDSDEEHEGGEGKGQGRPLAVLKVFKNNHIPETEVPLYQGENVLGRDPTSCSVPLQARSVSGRHAVISVSVFGPNERHAHSEATEALLWDLGSLNGTRKGRLKLTPHIRYALTEGDGLVLADLPCQYVSLKNADTFTADNGREKAKGLIAASGGSEGGTGNGGKKCALPPVPLWTEEAKSAESVQMSPRKPERTLVPESDSDSDGERHGRRDRKRIVVSDSASSDLSSPTCSTFLTPANKVIPESEDESSITPSSALKGRFLITGNDTKVSSDSPKPEQLLFNIDSDTDVEDEEEEMMKDAPKTVRAEVGAVTPADLHMDSDTDVEDEDIEKAKSDPEALAVPVKQDTVNPAVLNMDSDTDVEDNEPVKMRTTKVLSGDEESLEEKKDTESSSSQLHLESDTDVEDEDDVPRMQDSKPPTSHEAEFNLNSDTDVDEDETTKGDVTESKDLEAKSVDSVKVPDAKMSHDQSDIDTDVEDDDNDTEIRTPAAAKATGKSPTRSENQTADTSDINVHHDRPVQDEDPFRLDSDTDVEEDEDKVEEKEQKSAESTVQVIHSSTPKGAGVSGEELETQAFLSPSQLFKRPGLPSLLHPSVSLGGITHPDDDFAVAETQSFVCDAAQADASLDETPQSLDGPESRHSHGASSFQLSLSDSSHQVPEAAEHDGEPAEEEWQMQATQLYEMKNSEDGTKAGEMQDLDSTQAYVCATGQEEEEDGEKDEEEQETEPLDTQTPSSIHTAETQLIQTGAQNEDNGDRDTNEEVVASEPEIKAEEDVNDEMQVDSHLSTADTLLIVRSPRQEEHTQPYAFLAAQIQKEQEETEKEEHESRGLEDREDEGERAREEGRTGIEKENELTREEDKQEWGENERVENDDEVDDAQTQLTEADPIVETLPMCEEEEGQEEEQMNECRSSRGTRPAHVESTQPLEPDDHIHVTIAETLPMFEEEEGQEEEKNKPRKCRGAGRKRQTAKIETDQPVESDKVTRVSVAETQPMCEEDEEGQEEEKQSATISTRRSSTRRQGVKTKPHVAIPETLPLCEEEEAKEEAPPSEAVSDRKSRRGRQIAKVETAPATEPDSTTDTGKMEEEEEVQDSRRNLRAKERGRAASEKVKGRGRAGAGKEKRGKRGKMEQEEDSEEEVERGNKGRGRKSLRLKSKDDDEARLELMEAGNEEMDHVKQQEESKRLQMEKKKEARDQQERKTKEREESTRLEKEWEEREEREKMERLEREKKEREEKEMKEKGEMERLEREKQLEKERREQVEKDRLERERIEKENREKEEKEKLEREMRERQELEEERKKQDEKDRLEKERIEKGNKEKARLEREMRERQELEKERKTQEKDRLEKEKRDRKAREEEEKKSREEKEKQEQEIEPNGKEKKSKDDGEDMEKENERRPAPGKRKAGLQRRGKKSKKEVDQELEEGTKEGLETEQELSGMQKTECEEGNSKKQEDEQADGDRKTRRGRRTTRKSVAPPAGVEDEGGPAKRTRSRSNSSNSVCSEQSAQDSLNGGRGERRKTAEEQNDKGRPSGRRRTATSTASSSEKEEIKQASNSRSNSRSSERSSSSAATPSRGRGRKRSVKVEEPEEEEEREQSAAVGRGRGRGKGRGGKHPGGNDIKEDAAGKTEVMAVAEDSVMCQSSSRGRKRGVDVSVLMEETPQPAPKTPRRSLTGQTHKVLFTGVVDEDGEKVVVRLGAGLAKGVTDMTHLVTDKVRRTVKFLCAVARGVPIVTPDWLSKCGKAGSFLSPNGFLVKDTEQEKKFNFSLQESLRVASAQPLLQGYEIHVTPSVKPEPAHMKEIITCCGARFLPKMPSVHKAQTVVVVSCEEDRAVCERARSLSFPVVSAEFLLTGILQQKVDLQTHALSLSTAAAATKPASRSRGK